MAELDQDLLEILACPECKGNVEEKNKTLICTECGREYPIVDGIPHMLPDDLRT